MSGKPPTPPKPAGAASTKAVQHVMITEEEGSGSHDGTKVKKVTTAKYNLEQLKKITDFDSWVEVELEKLCPPGKVVEVDFEAWDGCAADKRRALLESKLAPSVGDTPARKKFVDEYMKRGAVILDIVHSASLQRTSSGSKLT